MAKKLIPLEVTSVGVHKRVMNNYKGIAEFTNENNIADIEPTKVLDMKNKIVIKSNFLYDDLKEDEAYDLLITQKMREVISTTQSITSQQQRERLEMKLVKIEIPSCNDGRCDDITYVFEKDDTLYINAPKGSVLESCVSKKEKLEEQQKAMNKLMEMMIEILKAKENS